MEYPFYPSKTKTMKKVHKFISIQERNNKKSFNVNDPEFEVEVGDKSAYWK